MTRPRPTPSGRRRILALNIGGTPVKVLASGRRQWVKFLSGQEMTPATMVAAARRPSDWIIES